LRAVFISYNWKTYQHMVSMSTGPECIDKCHELKKSIALDFPESKGWLHSVASDEKAKSERSKPNLWINRIEVRSIDKGK